MVRDGSPTDDKDDLTQSERDTHCDDSLASKAEEPQPVVDILSASVRQYGACGLAACSGSPLWRFIARLLQFLYAYYFFSWTVTFAALAICVSISMVYEAWVIGRSLPMAAIVM